MGNTGLQRIVVLSREHVVSARKSKINAPLSQEGDKLRWVDMCTEKCSVIVALSSGRAAHFATDEKHLRSASRKAEGVKVCTPL